MIKRRQRLEIIMNTEKIFRIDAEVIEKVKDV